MSNRIVLIGDKSSKQYTYFKKASIQSAVDLTFMDYQHISLKKGDVVKIDPPKIESTYADSLKEFVPYYKKTLQDLFYIEGIIALKYNYKKDEAIIYTTLMERKGRYLNSKRVSRVHNMPKIKHMIDFILGLDAVVEKWMPKKKHEGVMVERELMWVVASHDILFLCLDTLRYDVAY